VKYPFQKKSFWIILVVLFLVIFLFLPVYSYSTLDRAAYKFGGWEFFFDLGSYHGIAPGMLLFEMIIALLLNYLGYLIFSKPEKK